MTPKGWIMLWLPPVNITSAAPRRITSTASPIAWALAAFGALSLANLPGEYGHSLCGPWGCLPPLQALAAMHLFWVVVLGPPVAWALMKWQPRPVK